LRGDPERDLDALGAYWKVLPSMRVYRSAAPGLRAPELPLADVKPPFSATPIRRFQKKATRGCGLAQGHDAALAGFGKDGTPRR